MDWFVGVLGVIQLGIAVWATWIGLWKLGQSPTPLVTHVGLRTRTATFFWSILPHAQR